MPPDARQRDPKLLRDILNWSRKAVDAMRGVGLEAFLADEDLQDATLYRVVVIGEAAYQLSEDMRSSHPDIAWHAMAGMRHRIVHGYEQVDMERVWRTVLQDLPAVMARLELMIGPEE